MFYLTEFVPMVAFVLDIFVTLNTSYYSKGALIDNKFKIMKNYFKKHFILDLITTGPMVYSILAKY